MLNLSHQRTRRRLTSKNPVSERAAARLQKITKGEELFNWMWNQLAQSGPQVAVSGFINSDLEELYDAISSGRALAYPPIEWTVIWNEVRWDNLGDLDAPRCSVALIGFVGQLCETIILDGGGQVSPIRACEMMMSGWDRPGAYFKYQERQNSTYLISTPLCARDLGVQAEVALTDVPMNEECWSLTGSAEWP